MTFSVTIHSPEEFSFMDRGFFADQVACTIHAGGMVPRPEGGDMIALHWFVGRENDWQLIFDAVNKRRVSLSHPSAPIKVVTALAEWFAYRIGGHLVD
jgi:hypothetical protein